MPALRVLFLGDPSHHEFCEPVAWLREYCELTVVDRIDSACARLAEFSEPPEVIVIAAVRPGEFSQHDLARLLRLAPLARFVGLMGGWCEGETRTGLPWRGVTRVYWHEFVPRLAQELTGLNRHGRLVVPRTYTESELNSIPAPLPEPMLGGLILIRAASLQSFQSIAEACLAIGSSAAWANPRQPTFATGITAAIWDATTSLERDKEELIRFAKQVHPAPLMALISFPRGFDRQFALEHGVSSVVSKPFLLQELWTELIRVTATSPRPADRSSAA